MVDFKGPDGNRIDTPRKPPLTGNPANTGPGSNPTAAPTALPGGTNAAAGDCGTGGSNPNTPGAATGEQAGADPNAPNMKDVAGGTRQGDLQPSFKKNMSEIGAKNNVTFEGFSNGNTPGSATGSSRHGAHLSHHNPARVSGYATDARIRDNSTGRLLNPASPGADRNKVCDILKDAGSRGINGIGYDSSGYMGQNSMHFDAWGTGNTPYRGSPASWGAGGSGSRAQPWVQSCVRGGPPTGGGSTAGDNPAGGGGGGDPCNPSDGGGCQPISSGAAGAASSMMAGQGMAPAAGLLQQAAAVAQNPLSIAGTTVQQFAAAAGGPLGQGAAMLSGGLSDPTSFITKGVQGAIAQIGGAGPLSALTGVIPTAFSGGGLTGMLTQNLQNVAGSIIKQGIPQLGNFANVFNSALGAAGSATNIATAINGSVQQIFGKATGGILSQLPGINLTDFDPLEGIEGADSIITEILKPKIDSSINFTGPVRDVLNKAVNAKEFDAFSSSYMDFNSMVTHGFGNLTDNLVGLGKDLEKLGKVGDMTDLLNIGTPKQLTRQLIENGLGISTGLLPKINEGNLSSDFYNSEDNNGELRTILNDISNPDVIKYVKEVMDIDPNLQIDNLGDLLKSNVIFKESFEYNRFNELREIALTLTMCNPSQGTITTLGQLGKLLRQMETAEYFAELNEEFQPLRVEEADSLSAIMLTESYFGNNGPVLADFIGTAAGYVHADTLPAIATLLNEITGIAELSNFDALMVLLAETLQGNYRVVDGFTGEVTIVVPPTASYTFGIYTTLDNAVTAIKNSIETELQSINDDAKINNPELYTKLRNLQSFHSASAQYLYHEQRMRQAYGIDIGDSRGVDNYVGDGSTIAFPLSGLNPKNIVVYMSGVYQAISNYSYNSTTKNLIFSTTPAQGTLISISYDTDSSLPEGTPADVWQLASSLESHALETGFGGPADFLNRVATNDRHGQRIRAIMIQARNKAILEEAGLACPGYNRISNPGDEKMYVNFVEQTGIWTSDPGRAAEIWVQNNSNVLLMETYILEKYKQNRQTMQEDIDVLNQNLVRQMIFYKNGDLVISDLMANLYSSNQNNEIYFDNRPDLAINYSNELPSEGFIIGPYKEIVSAITNKENMRNEYFVTPLSTQTETYLKSIGMDMGLLITIMQRVLTVSASKHIGILESDFKDLFGVQSVSRALLQNIANNY